MGAVRGCLCLSLPYSCHVPWVEVGPSGQGCQRVSHTVGSSRPGRSVRKSGPNRARSGLDGRRQTAGLGFVGEAQVRCRSLPVSPSARRPREGNKCTVLPVAPFRLFPPSRSCPLRTRWPRPRDAPPPRLCSGANLRPRLFSRTCARSGAGAAVIKCRLGCSGAARAARIAGRSRWFLCSRVRMCEAAPGHKMSAGMPWTVCSFVSQFISHLLSPKKSCQ